MWFPIILGLFNIFALSGFFIYGETKIQNQISQARSAYESQLEEYESKLEEQSALYDIQLDIERTVIEREVNDNFLRIIAEKCRPRGNFVITAKETGETRFYTCKEEKGYNT